jgi:hypothetical protein
MKAFGKPTRSAGVVAASATALAALVAVTPAASAATLKPFSVSVTSTCTLAGITSPLTATVSGKTPATVLHGKPFAITGLTMSVTFPGSLTSIAAFFGVHSGSGTVSQLGVGLTNATPSTANAIPAGTTVSTGNLPVVGGQPLTLTIPPTGSLSVKGLVAQSPGSVVISAGAVTASVTASPWLNNSTLSCSSPGTTLTTITAK